MHVKASHQCSSSSSIDVGQNSRQAVPLLPENDGDDTLRRQSINQRLSVLLLELEASDGRGGKLSNGEKDQIHAASKWVRESVHHSLQDLINRLAGKDESTSSVDI